MEIHTHQAIDANLCGQPLEAEQGRSRVALKTTPEMAVDKEGLAHGGFILVWRITPR